MLLNSDAFTAITRVRTPSGTPIKNQRDTINFAETSEAQKGTTFTTLFPPSLPQNLGKNTIESHDLEVL
jgi:hypothetical protein